MSCAYIYCMYCIYVYIYVDECKLLQYIILQLLLSSCPSKPVNRQAAHSTLGTCSCVNHGKMLGFSDSQWD